MKKQVAFIFGGESYEHEISIRSLKSILENVDRNKYMIDLIYIDRKGTWYFCENPDRLENKVEIKNIEVLKKYDMVFPILHGNYGEDGNIQGLFEILHVPYVGCKTKSSAICMDKDYTKKILSSAKISIVPYLVATKDTSLKTLQRKIRNKIGYPCFIKPSSLGSSIGTCKVTKKQQLENAIKEALQYDEKVLIEKYIKGREVEVAILENKKLIISNIGEVFSGEEFYSYNAKYNCEKSYTKIPTHFRKKTEKKIKDQAKKAYLLLACKDLARIDFFVSKTGKVYLNEINTMPGFTSISMYPSLMEEISISFPKLIDYLLSGK